MAGPIQATRYASLLIASNRSVVSRNRACAATDFPCAVLGSAIPGVVVGSARRTPSAWQSTVPRARARSIVVGVKAALPTRRAASERLATPLAVRCQQRAISPLHSEESACWMGTATRPRAAGSWPVVVMLFFRNRERRSALERRTSSSCCADARREVAVAIVKRWLMVLAARC